MFVVGIIILLLVISNVPVLVCLGIVCVEYDTSFLSQKGVGGRCVKKKNQVSANDAAKDVGVPSALDEPVLSSLGGPMVEKVMLLTHLLILISLFRVSRGLLRPKLVIREPSRKSVNFCTLLAPAANRADVAISLESVRAVSEHFDNTVYGFFWGKWVVYPMVDNYVKNTWSKYELVKSMLNSFNGLLFFKFSSKDGMDAMLENGMSSYSRAMIELRADVELKDTIAVAMPKLVGDGFYMFTIRVDYEWKPSRHVSNKNSASKSGNIKQGELSRQEVSNSNPFDALNLVEDDDNLGTNRGNSNSAGKGSLTVTPGSSSTTHIAEKIDKLKRQILDEKLIDSEVEEVFNETVGFVASTGLKSGSESGYGTKSLLEQWMKTKVDDDYDPYDDDLYDGYDMCDNLQAICDIWISSNKDEFNLSLVSVITIVVVILAILWYKLTLLSSSNGAPSLPPGPWSLPIVGYLPFLGPDPHLKFTEMAQTYGPIFKTYLGSKLHIVISSPEFAKAMFRDQDENFSNRNAGIATSIISYGDQDVVWSDNNSTWRNLRKILVQEVLNTKSLQETSYFRRDEVRKTIKHVFTKIGSNISINELFFITEANVLTSMVWGNSLGEEAKDGQIDQAEFRLAISKMFELLIKPNVSDFIPSLAWLDLQGVARDMKREFHRMDQFITTIINNRIESNSRRSKDAVLQHEGKKDLLQVLLELHNQKNATSPSMTHIKALIMDIMVAGIDSTTTLVEWTMTEILKNRHVMDRVQEELANIVGVNSMVEESHLPKLQYLAATIKETLRVHPVGPIGLPRSPSQTCVVGGYTIPKGCTVYLNLWALNRDPRSWDNPLEFNPDRFMTQDGTKNGDFQGNNMKFLPFGTGRRLCPGYPLADKMQTYILASLFHSFNWTLPKGEEHDLSGIFLGISLKKKKPLIVIPSQRLSDVSLYM
ncbi:cytochrome P450 [Tanacetum coccineum]